MREEDLSKLLSGRMNEKRLGTVLVWVTRILKIEYTSNKVNQVGWGGKRQ